jgi:hypothetical protein
VPFPDPQGRLFAPPALGAGPPWGAGCGHGHWRDTATRERNELCPARQWLQTKSLRTIMADNITWLACRSRMIFWAGDVYPDERQRIAMNCGACWSGSSQLKRLPWPFRPMGEARRRRSLDAQVRRLIARMSRTGNRRRWPTSCRCAPIEPSWPGPRKGGVFAVLDHPAVASWRYRAAPTVRIIFTPSGIGSSGPQV